MHRRTTILNISPDPGVERMLVHVLNDAHVRIESCTLPAQYVRMCVSLQPGLVFVVHDKRCVDGRKIIAAIRKISQSPIIVLSAHGSDAELVEFLALGTNDYLGAPFSHDVLRARMLAALRTRTVQEAGTPDIVNGCLRIDLVRHEVYVANMPVAFTPKEYELLRYFMVHRGKMLSHRDILRAVWGPAHGNDAIYLRVYIGQIRKKIESVMTRHSMIKSECGIGYRMELLDHDVSPARDGHLARDSRMICVAQTSPSLYHPVQRDKDTPHHFS